jgi:hypothetical protein
MSGTLYDLFLIMVIPPLSCTFPNEERNQYPINIFLKILFTSFDSKLNKAPIEPIEVANTITSLAVDTS